MVVRRIERRDRSAWLQMRAELWPEEVGSLAGEVDAFLAGQTRYLDEVFICEADDASAVGFIELRIRNYAEGSEQESVPFVEGWYVSPGARGHGVGRLLMERAAQWARSRGYSELASDTQIDNVASCAAHGAVGFQETERLVCFLKKLL